MPISDIFDYTTVAQLAAKIESRLEVSVLPGGVEDRLIKLLVPIKVGGNKPPLYIVCGTGGTAFKFKKFADILDANQPVYGLQQPDVKNGHEFPRTIESIAEKYLEEILAHNPHGPYALSGHCLGGIIAFEMAKQLKTKGKEVKLLAMLDTIVMRSEKLPRPSYKNFYHVPFLFKVLLSKLSVKVDFEVYLWKHHTRQAVRYKLNSLRTITNRMHKHKRIEKPEDISMEVFNEMSVLYKRAIRNYQLTPYNGEILVFFAKEHYYFLDKENNVGFKKVYIDAKTKNMWNQYGTSVKIFEVEGEHSNIFDPVHAKDFATLLQQQLNSTERH
jgi:thioesterase domain-containing protein